MASGRREQLILRIIATDATFTAAPVLVRGERVWVGKCIHCGSRLVVGEEGTPQGSVTVEHIVPRAHGGTDALDNLALACARCNHGKGVRHDAARRLSARAREVIDALLARRRQRWREPGP